MVAEAIYYLLPRLDWHEALRFGHLCIPSLDCMGR